MLSVLAAPVGAVLYRLRGGWWRDLTGAQRWYNGTHAMRLIWAIPTSLLAFLQAGDGLSLWQVPALAIAVWASLALWGHGAHMTFANWQQWLAFANKTENLTDWWLPQLMGQPGSDWPVWKLETYNLLGMSWIGFVRQLTMVATLANSRETEVAVFAFLGVLHGPLYWAAYKVGGDSRLAECFVGAFMWACIVAVFQ